METTHREDWRLACLLPATMNGQEVYIKLKVPPFTIYNKKIGYGLPNACALYLGNAYKLYIQSKDFKKQIFNDNSLKAIPDNLAYTFLENIIGSILFAYSAIEAFTNYEIPDDHYHYKKKKKLIIAEGKNTIERCEPIDVKLCKIIPEVWKIDSPKNKKVWYDFKSYKDIRDRLVHVKTVDQRALGQQADDLWSKLFIQHDYLSPEVVKKLISYYYDRKKENTPDWYKNFPY